jgi:hypothetical protein
VLISVAPIHRFHTTLSGVALHANKYTYMYMIDTQNLSTPRNLPAVRGTFVSTGDRFIYGSQRERRRALSLSLLFEGQSHPSANHAQTTQGRDRSQEPEPGRVDNQRVDAPAEHGHAGREQAAGQLVLRRGLRGHQQGDRVDELQEVEGRYWGPLVSSAGGQKTGTGWDGMGREEKGRETLSTATARLFPVYLFTDLIVGGRVEAGDLGRVRDHLLQAVGSEGAEGHGGGAVNAADGPIHISLER